MKHSHPSSAIILMACFVFSTLLANAQSHQPRVYGKGHPFQLDELPAGKLKTGLQSLDPQAKGKALKWLHEINFAEFDAAEHLRVDNGGGIYIVCPDDHGNCEGHPHGPAKPESTNGVSPPPESIPGTSTGNIDPPIEKAAVSVSAPPAYNSKPGATRHIYLDFNGGIVTGTAWNSSSGVSSYNVKVWTQDADITTFNDAEQTWMRRVWQRVAEDYAPFDVNVTTDVTYDPDTYTGNKDNVGWLLICETTDNNAVALPHNGSGGIAYVGVFGSGTYSPTYQPAWVSSTNGGGNEAIVAEAASHEMGHNVGLTHDGTSTLAYYGGHAGTASAPSWGPIMGTGYNQNVSQWSKGEYYDSLLTGGNPQSNVDDLAIMSARIPYRADDHGDTSATATTWISSPVNQAGIVENTGDPDYFKFTTIAGPVSFSANPFRSDADTWGGNLDVLMELYDSNQVLVASNNPAATATASISTTVAAGTYYLVIKPTSTGTPLVTPPSGYTTYGSLGQYTITGSYVVSSEPEIAVEQPVGTDLTDGSASINCGSVTIGGTSSPLTFTVRNVGTANLTGLSVSKDGANSGDFTVSSLGATTLAGGTSTTFTVTFSPGASGSRTAAIHIASNDADENPFDINLTGTGTTPGVLAVTSTTGLASSGSEGGPFSPSSVSYTLTNSGGISINWAASKTQSWVTLGATSGTLAAGANTTVTVSINSGANSLVAGGYSDLVSFVNSTNGSGNTSRDVALSITGFSSLASQNFDASSSPPVDWSTSGGATWTILTSPLTSHTPNNSYSAPVPNSKVTSYLVSSAIGIPADATTTQIRFWHRYNLESTKDGGRLDLSVDGGASWIAIDDPGSGAAFGLGGYSGTISTTGNPASRSEFNGKQAWTGLSANSGASFSETVVNLTDAAKYSGKSLRIRWGMATNDLTASSFWYVDSLSLQSNSSSSSPGTLAVTPAVDLNSSGPVGGPFLPATQDYTLQNTGSTSINWTAAKTAGWVTLSATNGNLAAGASTIVTASINSTANSLLAGGYNDIVSFTNSTNSAGNSTRNIALSVVGSGSLSVTPAENLVSSGSFGGPFSPASKQYTLQNTGTTPLNWTATKSTTWVTLSSTGGTLDAGASTTVTASINSTANSLNAGGYSDTVSFTDGTGNETRTVSLTVNPAAATVTLGSLSQTYTGSAKSATATTSPAGLSVSFTYNGSATQPTNAGSYAVVGTINDINYTGSSSGTLVIAKAPATVTLGGLSQTYNGTAKSATATTSPASLSVGFTYNGSATAPTNAGSYTVVGTINDTNYAGSASGTLVIAKASATVTLGSLSQTYNGTAKSATATTSPAGLTVGFTYNGSSTAPTNAGSYTVVGTINDTNYTGSSSGTLVIAKASATVTLGSLSQTYNGTAKSATATTSPASLSVGFTYNGSATPPTNAGSYAVVGTINDTNYAGNNSGTLVIAKASATVTLGSLSQTYNGSSKSATATTSPAGISVGFTYDGSATAPINAGSYAVSATITDPNYTGNSTGTLVIAKATATVSLSGLSATYDGTQKPVAATTSPVGLTVAFSYDGSSTAPTNAGPYAIVATINDPNYTGSSSGTLVIAKATATVTLGSLSQTYNGSAKSATAITSPAGLIVDFTYDGFATQPTNAGPYAVVATINDINYTGSSDGALVISKATATVTLGSLSQTYNGAAKSTTATTSPAGLIVDFTYDGFATQPTNAGSYAVVATINDINYAGSSDGALVISKATATVTLGSLSQTYNGGAKSATATTSPADLTVSFTYNGSPTLPVDADTYDVVATISNANYQGSASGSLEIAKASATVQLAGLSQAYDGNSKSVTATTVPAGLSVSITYDGSSTSPSTSGSYAIIASVTDTNYTGSSSGTLVISNDLVVTASESLALPNSTVTYDSLLNDGTLSFGAGTVNITGDATNHGVLRLTGNAVLNVSGTFTNTGVIDIINWSGTLPPSLVNTGTILDRSAIRVTSTQASATTFTLSVPSYAGHLYQLETKTDLTAAWQPLGPTVAGTGTAANPPALRFTPPLDGPRRFYRVVVTPAP